MRKCEFCGASVDDTTNKCTGCGAPQSTIPASATPVAHTHEFAQGNAASVPDGKPKGSWGCLIGWLIIFWPVAVFYYLSRSWK